jgi:hypothetical protein
MSIHPDIPEVCYAFLEEESAVIGILRGQPGYRIPGNLPDQARESSSIGKAWVDRQNDKMGVTPAQREAMAAGSMFGWHLPIADPEKFPTAARYT